MDQHFPLPKIKVELPARPEVYCATDDTRHLTPTGRAAVEACPSSLEDSPDPVNFSDSPKKRKIDIKKLISDKKLFRCQHCRYLTDRKNNLKRHVVTMHESCTKMLECCDAVFPNKSALREHVVSFHKKGYDCRICGRNFCRKALLKRHVTVHSGQKDFICDVCGYATSHKSNLDRHKRRHFKLPTLQDKTRIITTPSKSRDHHTKQQQQQSVTDFSIASILSKPSKLERSSVNGKNILTNKNSISKPHSKTWTRKYLLKKRLTHTYDRQYHTGNFTAQRTFDAPGVKPEFITTEPMGISPNIGHRHHSDYYTPHHHDAVAAYKDYGSLMHRLFPALYKCRICDTMFEKQLQFTHHHEMLHSQVINAPQRPLTLQARKVLV